MQLRFEDFILDSSLRELRRLGVEVSLPPKVFDLLCHLVQHRDRVVTKDDLLATVWEGRFVSESTLGSHINAVRRALGDDGVQQRVVRTIARKGFRFVAEVATDQGRELIESPGYSALMMRNAEAGGLPSIGVRPFATETSDWFQNQVAEGVREELLVALTQEPMLHVVALGRGDEPANRNDGVDYLLTASVRGAGDRFRISVRLLDASSGRHLWAASVLSFREDLLGLEESVSSRVRAAVRGQLERAETERVRRKPDSALGAYDHFLIGQALMGRGGRADVDAAMSHFRVALTIDPEFGPSYGGLAWSHVLRKHGLWMDDIDRESAEGARIAELAVRMNDDDPTAVIRGSYALGHFGEDLGICAAYMDKALRADPRSALGWYLSGGQFLSAGRRDEAMRRIARAARANPNERESADIAILTTLAHLLDGRADAATANAETAFSLAPSNPRAFGLLAASNAQGGRRREAAHAMHLLLRHSPELRVGSVRSWIHLRHREDLEIFVDGLRSAGLPA
ncbi:winged helix-turn-helix domain-containing protein [Sphingomonas sp. NFR15]|uniref:winged helix-turn-helix domain-containing protein n=1 Tax=Sphingomonas sp. NFR15 TaxID=1566282 RepID=UPI000881DFAD|nr:winged helix-turn-helix domain-containing protein [Sphingomonas sp. NFR15]SDA36171.1 DNA-binding winged helix-turn-helix (wHTH) domain-containing protein [Sphingomonas sp. NFR15]